MLEPLLKMPVSAELASEFRYRNPAVSENTLVIAISQSGETLDTLESVKFAVAQKAQVLAVCNVHFASIPRTAQGSFYMEAGPEIGVASTKAFTSQILCLYLLALEMARRTNKLPVNELRQRVSTLQLLPPLVEKAVSGEAKFADLVNRYYESPNCLFIGRGESFAIAMEGALKLKEISYIHAEAYAGGELKHGPIALIDHKMPVIALVPKDKYYTKMISNIEEIRAREGIILAVGASDDLALRKLSSDYLECPQIGDSTLQAILSTIPMQLLSYYMAVKRGTDVDQPRNLAKSVTVE